MLKLNGVVGNDIYNSYDICFLNFAVTAPAGFPDHPHRGLKFGCLIGFFFQVFEINTLY